MDDLTGGGTGPGFQAALGSLLERFAFGKWESYDVPREYYGRSIQQLPDFTFDVSMQSQVNKVQPIPVDKVVQGNCMANDMETHQYRAILGSLLWSARSGLPETVARAKQQATRLTIPAIPPAELKILAWADASFCNAEDQRTQTAC
eukprot:3930204-Amphidinium_carterae.1